MKEKLFLIWSYMRDLHIMFLALFKIVIMYAIFQDNDKFEYVVSL